MKHLFNFSINLAIPWEGNGEIDEEHFKRFLFYMESMVQGQACLFFPKAETKVGYPYYLGGVEKCD